ncbi:MAG: hypothetical protein RI990_1769 [Planctomycetota bacterium]
MAKWNQLTEFVVRLPHRAGELARLASQLREAHIEVLTFFGPTEGRSADGFHLVPQDASRFREWAGEHGLETWEEPCFHLSDAYHDGDLVGKLDAIAGAGINIDFALGLEAGGQFGLLLWVDDADVDRLAKHLGAD